jgi:prevent-host-death family protein
LHHQSKKGIIFALEPAVNLESNIRPISYIKTHAAEMLQEINETQNPIVITQNGLAKGVLLDTRSYQEMVDAIGILKLLSQAEHQIERGHTVSHEQAIDAALEVIDEK